MLDGLLSELERVVPASKKLENIEEHMPAFVRLVGEAVEDMKGSARAFENIWQSIIMEVAKGRAAEIQADRPGLLNCFETRLSQLQRAHTFVTWLAALGRAEVPDPNVLVPEIEGIERLKARVFDRWHSADDLEKLAVEQYPLSQSRLEELASANPPPAEWYEEEEQQLFQE
jgi:hypothetical protein